MTMRALVVSRGNARWSPEGHQVHGFSMYAKALRSKLGLTTEMTEADTLGEIEEAVSSRTADVAFIMVSWRETPGEVTDLFRRLSSRPGCPRLVFLDYFAPASSPYFDVLPYVDAYFKRQAYRDPENHGRDFEGGNLLTEFVSRDLGIELDGWNFSSKPDKAHVHKIVAGWNLGVTPHYHHLLKLTAALPLPWERRPFAVNCRLGLSSGPRQVTEWYHHYREYCVRALEPLRQEYRCTGSERVRLRRYFAEMILSKIGVSPFGWGEVCFRDYEVVASGALLIKPSMSHLKTSPDIYQDGKTYVAASWDMSDVPDLCRHYLAHPEEAREIVHNARSALLRYFEDDGFVEDVRRVLANVGLFREDHFPLARRVPSLV